MSSALVMHPVMNFKEKGNEGRQDQSKGSAENQYIVTYN
jgi:hypothetical protein